MPDAGPLIANLTPPLEEHGYAIFPISALTGEGVTALLYAISERLKQLPIEAPPPETEIVRFTGPQTLSDTLASVSRAYVTIDARLERPLGPAILFVRGKNLTDVRQAHYAPVLLRASGPAGQWTGDVWAPLDGRALNAGLRMMY